MTPAKNLWHCFGCGAGGGPIDWVIKKNGVSFRHAVELLRSGTTLLNATPEVIKHVTVSSLAAHEIVELPVDIPEPTIISPLPPTPTIDTPTEQNDTDLILTYGERRYRIRGLEKVPEPRSIKSECTGQQRRSLPRRQFRPR